MVARPFEGRRGPEGGGGLRGPEGAGGGGSERTASRRRAERRGPPEHSRGPGNKELPGLAGWPRTVSCLYSCPSDSAPPLRLPTLPSPPFLHLLAGSPLKTPSCFPPTSEAPSPPPPAPSALSKRRASAILHGGWTIFRHVRPVGYVSPDHQDPYLHRLNILFHLRYSHRSTDR